MIMACKVNRFYKYAVYNIFVVPGDFYAAFRIMWTLCTVIKLVSKFAMKKMASS